MEMLFWAVVHVALVLRKLPANAGDMKDVGLILGLVRSSGEGNGNPLQFLALRIPWTEEPGGQQPIGCRVRHIWGDLAQHLFSTMVPISLQQSMLLDYFVMSLLGVLYPTVVYWIMSSSQMFPSLNLRNLWIYYFI